MTLAAGTKLGPYKILSPLEAGGIGKLVIESGVLVKCPEAILGNDVSGRGDVDVGAGALKSSR
jgi:hypothetical protein